MKQWLPTRKLPEYPDLDHLKRQAKELLVRYEQGENAAQAEVQRFFDLAGDAPLALHQAQLVIARSYGFPSWPKLKAFVDGVTVERLLAAVQASDVEEVNRLLRLRPELVSRVSRSSEGRTALHYAVLGRMREMTRILMEAGADPRVTTAGLYALRDAASPLGIASERGYEEITEILIEQDKRHEAAAELTPQHVTDPDELLRKAVRDGNDAFLRKLARETDIVTPRDDQGWLLAEAVDTGQFATLKLLLELGLDPDARVQVEDEDPLAITWGMPLYQSLRARNHAMAELLLQHGADPNGQVYASGTPLSEAFGQGDEKMIALLEQYGGKANASMAGLYRRPDLAQRLLAEFGDTSLPDDGFASGTVAEQLLGAAARGGDAGILQMAIDRVSIPAGDVRWHRLLPAPLGFWNHWTGPWCHPEWDRSTYLACFRLLLQKSGPPNEPLNAGARILHQIVVMGQHVTDVERHSFAEAALDAGARLDVRDDLLLSTPLGWACRWGREDLVRLFLERGADAVEKDAEPWATPVAWALKRNHTGIASMLRAAMA